MFGSILAAVRDAVGGAISQWVVDFVNGLLSGLLG